MEKLILKQGIKEFCQKGYRATYYLMLQIHEITCFKPIKVKYLNPRKRKIVFKIANFLEK